MSTKTIDFSNIPKLSDVINMDTFGNVKTNYSNYVSAGTIIYNCLKPIETIIKENVPVNYTLHNVDVSYLDGDHTNLNASNLVLYIVYGQKDNVYITKVPLGNSPIEYTEPRIAVLKNDKIEHIAISVTNAAKYASLDRSTVSHILHGNGKRHVSAKGYTFKFIKPKFGQK